VETTAKTAETVKATDMMNRKDKIVSAVGAPPPPRAPTMVETPELEDSAECAGRFDTDNI